MTTSFQHTTVFELHPQLSSDTILVGEMSLCRVLLMNDARFPWLILVPRRPNVSEIFQLAKKDQARLLAESSTLSAALMEQYRGDKLNIAALGNIVPQLHVHHIVRFITDAAWPQPVWGYENPIRYTRAESKERLSTLKTLLSL